MHNCTHYKERAERAAVNRRTFDDSYGRHALSLDHRDGRIDVFWLLDESGSRPAGLHPTRLMPGYQPRHAS